MPISRGLRYANDSNIVWHAETVGMQGSPDFAFFPKAQACQLCYNHSTWQGREGVGSKGQPVQSELHGVHQPYRTGNAADFRESVPASSAPACTQQAEQGWAGPEPG